MQGHRAWQGAPTDFDVALDIGIRYSAAPDIAPEAGIRRTGTYRITHAYSRQSQTLPHPKTTVILGAMKNHRKILSALLLIPLLCSLLTGCPRLWGSAGSDHGSSGGVVIDVPF